MLLPRLRHWPFWLAVGLLVVLAVWVRPRRIEGLATLDGKHRWLADSSAPTRQFAWQPGEELNELLPAHDPPHEVSHPCLADEGRTLYLTVRRADGDADIYRSAMLNDQWQTATAVTELNTPWDEEAVALSADGRQLYLASNRHGGKGGFDLYVSQRRASGWGVPKNLGDAINTADDEVDPAISDEGLQLYFASNRATQETTDLYFARRNSLVAAWSAPAPLSRANSPANERSPCLGNDGVLYFGSDRPIGRVARNFDLYRLRLNDAAAPAEGLGRAVNTPADETDPAIAADSLNLTFSRRADGAPAAVYQSRLGEVTPFIVWDNSRWQALRAVWWKAALATSLFAGVVAVLYYSGGWLRRRASAARFAAASLLVHAVVLWLMVLVPLSQEIVKRIEEIQVTNAATELFDDNLHQSHLPGEQAYEKVADLKSVEKVETPPLVRQVTTPTNVPLHADDPAPTLPLELARRLPADRVLFVPSPLPAKPAAEVARNAEPAIRVAQIEPLAAEPPKRVEAPNEKPLEEDVEAQRVAAGMVLPNDAPEKQRPLTEIALQPATLEPAMNEMTHRDATPDRPAPRAIREAAPPAEVDMEATVLTAVERMAEKSVLDAGPTSVTISTKEPTAPKPSSEESASPQMAAPKIASQPIQAVATNIAPQPAKMELRRTTSDSKAVAIATADEPLVLAKVDAAPEASVAPAKIDLTPVSPAMLLPASDSPQAGGSREAGKRELIVGTLAKKPIDAPPSLNPLASQLQRATARATAVAYAEDNVGMQAMFALRQGDTRREFIDLVGGNEQTEAAVKRGLAWLAEHQHADGRWSLHQLDPPEKKLPATSGSGGTNSDAAATGLGLLPFLGSAYTHLAGDYKATVGRGIEWLVNRQKPDGNLYADPPSVAFMYSHGIASIALCEAYGMSQDERLREPAQRGLNFIVAAQHQGGGWRYQPGEPGDTSVVGWQVMALKSGEMAGLAVPKSALDLANKWLDSAAGTGGSLGTFGYQGPGGSPAMTAEGLLCRQFLGARRNDPAVIAGANYLLQRLPQDGQETSYYWYYATQVMYHMQGDYWTAWNERLRDLLVSKQIKDGHQAGTWDPRDGWEQSGGRLYATSLRLLMLEVYYRHLPLYQQLH